MTVKKAMPFELPDAPVDRYEVKWWHVEWFGAVPTVAPYRAVYHVNSRWADVYPDDRRGADFVNHWQIFRRNSFTGRSRDGWREAWAQSEWSFSFGSYEAACAEAVGWCLDRIARLTKELQELEKARAGYIRGVV